MTGLVRQVLSGNKPSEGIGNLSTVIDLGPVPKKGSVSKEERNKAKNGEGNTLLIHARQGRTVPVKISLGRLFKQLYCSMSLILIFAVCMIMCFNVFLFHYVWGPQLKNEIMLRNSNAVNPFDLE